MLRKGLGANATAAKLKRMEGKQADRSRGAKVTRKNIDNNYAAARVAALPPMVKLTKGITSIQEQLATLLQQHSVKLIDLFREWTMTATAHSTRRVETGCCSVGYKAPKKDIDAFFESIDVDNSWINLRS